MRLLFARSIFFMTQLTLEIAKKFMYENGLAYKDVADLHSFLSNDERRLNKEILGIEAFIVNEHYLNARDKSGGVVIYPEVMKALVELNSGLYSEAVLTGGIGTAKTTIALYTNAYQLYLLSCYESPHMEFGLDPSSEIVFIFQNLNAKKAKEVDYDRFRSLIERSPYFQKYFPFNKDIKSELQFPHRIIVKPVSGEESAAIGENIIGGMIDEVNFMEVVDKSKRSVDGGVYNQAEALYNSLARRRESRFMKVGKLPGILCLSSSKRYPGEFTDQKIEEAREDKSIYVYDRRIWDVKPAGTFSPETFEVFIGDTARNPYIIDPDKDDLLEEDEHLILEVPVDYLTQFKHDIMDALREIGGVALRSIRPFITDVTAISDAAGKTASILNRNEIEFKSQKLCILPKKIQFPKEPRYIHIDLGVTNDHAGIVMGCVPKFVKIDRGGSLVENLPQIHIDFAINVSPPRNGEIDFGRIRGLIYKLRELGVPIKWVSLDSFQSVDMIQRLKQKGFMSGKLSVDTDITPYIFCKNALLDRRVVMPFHGKLEKELMGLELNEEKAKVDHAPQGSKDLADGLCGVIYGLTIKREIWIKHMKSTIEMDEFVKRYMTKPIKQEDFQPL